ncbi:MAG: hypothetical protein ABJ004_01195 [Cyclobacteriaceae bacterium]
MMKTQLLKSLTFTMAVLAFAVSELYAQEFIPVDTTIVMDAGDFTPHEDGYYIAGVDKDLVGGDGIPEHYDGCFDAYGDADHREVGNQNGWDYSNVIIFRSCSDDPETVDDVIKGTQPEGWPSEGNLIQVTKHKYALTDSADYGHISSPAFTNISSLSVYVSTDLAINNSRSIFMMIEASLDGGETWEYIDNPDGTAFVYQQLTNQGGDIHTYTAGSNEGFDAIIAASQAGPIQLRFVSIPPPFTDTSVTNGERLNFWNITIEAQTAPKSNTETPLAVGLDKIHPFIIQNRHFIANPGENLFVYNLSGTLLGKGKDVEVSQKGLYVVKTSSGATEKVFLK